ncbi:MAG TPA: ASCH domain-containing protein [Mucilaginibacter sp.]|jgi:predicted transcriptional regulator
MKVVLSIKPEFAFKIFDGTKRYEFRKSIFKNKKVQTVLVYASSPVQRVIGEFQIKRIINHDIHTLWHLTQDFSGISEDYFFKYFEDKIQGYAIEINTPLRYDIPKNLKTEYNLLPPQSFAYFL